MKLTSEDLEQVSTLALGYYNRHAKDFWEGTKDHDVSQNISAAGRTATYNFFSERDRVAVDDSPIGS
jgi:hypothetical protein